MNLSEYIHVLRPEIEGELQRVIHAAIPEPFSEMKSMLSYHMGWEGEGAGPEAQGKRIRPLLVLLSAAAAGGDWQAALPAAASVELLHNFSLVHDDIQDGSPLRRGRQTVWVKWGTAQAINAGDVLFTLAFQSMQNLSDALPAERVLDACRLLQTTCLRLTEGQYLDMSYESRRDLPAEAYWPMIGGKTSALLGCCAELGALAAGVDGERRAAFQSYGYNLGLAFQVLDDWLGIWGDAEQTGKSVESDLVTGKKTLPVVYGLQQAGPFAARWAEGPVQPEEVPALADALKTEGAFAYTLRTAQELTEKALQSLSQAVVQNDAAQALQDLTRQLLKRQN